MENGKIVFENSGLEKFVKWFLFIVFFLSLGLNIYFLFIKKDEYKTVEKIKREVVVDTVRDTIPDVRYEKVLKIETDTFNVFDTIPGDTQKVVVEVPISQKEYGDDSTYRAWVSGYKPNLDSIDIYKKTVTITKEITKTKKPRIVIGPSIGYGYDFVNKKAAPTIGVSITYNLFGLFY